LDSLCNVWHFGVTGKLDTTLHHPPSRGVVSIQVGDKCPATRGAVVHTGRLDRRACHDPQHGGTLHAQPDVDGELAVPCDKVLQLEWSSKELQIGESGMKER
jgi:hypothetical protein